MEYDELANILYPWHAIQKMVYMDPSPLESNFTNV